MTGPTGPTGPTGVGGNTGATGAPGTDGSASAIGATGPQGLTGTNGTNGTTGAQGLQGVQGEVGAAGSPGATGSQGLTGDIGPAGPAGPAGSAGAAGALGPAGPAGPPGTPGAAGSGGLSEYAYVYNLGAQTVALEAAITFDNDGVRTSGITHEAGSAGVTLVNAGIYKVTFSISGTEPSQIALFDNEVAIPGSVYGSGAGTQPSTGQVIVAIAAGHVLTLRNHTSAAAVGLQTLSGGTQTNANASITIEKVG